MKRWLKKHGRYIMIGLGILFIVNSTYQVFTATEEWKVVLHAVGILIWLLLIGIYSGYLSKLYEWWEKE